MKKLFFLTVALLILFLSSKGQNFKTSKTKYIKTTIAFTKENDTIETLKVPKCLILERDKEQDLLLCNIPQILDDPNFGENAKLIITEDNNFWFIKFNSYLKNGKEEEKKRNKIIITFKCLCGNYMDNLSLKAIIGGQEFKREKSLLFDKICKEVVYKKECNNCCKQENQFKRQAENRQIANTTITCHKDKVKIELENFIKKGLKSSDDIRYSFTCDSDSIYMDNYIEISDEFDNKNTIYIEELFENNNSQIKFRVLLFNGKMKNK